MASPAIKTQNIKTEQVCRTCLSKENELYSAHEVTLGSVTLSSIVADTTGIWIDQSDGLPTTVCSYCKDKAFKAYEFRKQSQEANNTLQNIFKKENEEQSSPGTTLSLSETFDIKTEQTSATDDNDYGDWMSAEDFNDVEGVKSEVEVSSSLQCKNCGIRFNSLVKLKEHDIKCVKVEIEDPPSKNCPLCGTSYYDAVNLSAHMWENHADLMGPKKRGRPKKMLSSSILTKLTENGFSLKLSLEKYDCSICNKQFKDRDDHKKHLMKHKDTKVLCCLLCKKRFLKKKYFNVHSCGDDEGSVKKNAASDNDKSYLSEIGLGELSVHKATMVCDLCTGVFTSEDDFNRHTDAEHPERSLRCNLCLKVFASLKAAARHRNICKQIERKYKCVTCGLKFAYEISLNKHILRYHEGQSVSVKFMDTKAKDEEKQYQCDACNKHFSRKELLVKHTRTHSEKLYECDVCKKKFNRSDNLRSHKRTHDPREKTKASTCLCLYCGRSFNNSSNLIVHMRRHTGEKPYKCDFCGKGFPRSSDLQCHRRSHTGEKPCVCRVCGKGFSRSNKLSRHMRVHTGLKPYKCTYCEKAFSQSNDLTLHIRRHTGDKPYICEVCGDRFIQGTALHNHRRAHGHFPPTSSAGSQGQTFPPPILAQQNRNQ